MTTTFYAPPDAFRGNIVQLPPEEAQHVVRTLRKKPGDVIVVVDGEGGWHRVELTQAGKKQVMGRLLESQHDVGEPAYELTVALALLKNRNRYETFLEKAVELGATRILPLLTERTEKENFRMDRARNILIAAMKQCGRSCLTQLAEPQPLREALLADESECRLFCHDSSDVSLDFTKALDSAESISVWIGPEGGFTPEEVERAVASGAGVVTLGRRRLRAETAAIAVTAGITLYLNPTCKSISRNASIHSSS